MWQYLPYITVHNDVSIFDSSVMLKSAQKKCWKNFCMSIKQKRIQRRSRKYFRSGSLIKGIIISNRIKTDWLEMRRHANELSDMKECVYSGWWLRGLNVLNDTVIVNGFLKFELEILRKKLVFFLKNYFQI